jgi:hypothetical protein
MAYSVTGDVWLLQPADDESRLVLYSKGKEQEIALEGILYEFWWSETYDTFFAETFGGQLFTISPLGEVTELPIPPDEDGSRPSAHGVVVSPDGAWWAWQQYHFEDAPYLWIGGAMAEPSWIQPGKEDSVVSSVIWSLDGRRLFFADRQEGLWYVEPPDFELVHVSSDVLLVSDFAWIP